MDPIKAAVFLGGACRRIGKQLGQCAGCGSMHLRRIGARGGPPAHSVAPAATSATTPSAGQAPNDWPAWHCSVVLGSAVGAARSERTSSLPASQRDSGGVRPARPARGAFRTAAWHSRARWPRPPPTYNDVAVSSAAWRGLAGRGLAGRGLHLHVMHVVRAV